MDFRDTLDNLTKVKIEVSDLKDLNVEWYDDLSEWDNCMWSWVFRRKPYKVRENILTIKASILDLGDESSLKRFRDTGSKPTYHYISLEKLKLFLDSGRYTHVFIFGIGELSKVQTAELHEWIALKHI